AARCEILLPICATMMIDLPPVLRKAPHTFDSSPSNRTKEPITRQTKTQRSGKTTQSVTHASSEVDRRGFGQISRWAAHFPNCTAQRDHLRENLVVEHKVI